MGNIYPIFYFEFSGRCQMDFVQRFDWSPNSAPSFWSLLSEKAMLHEVRSHQETLIFTLTCLYYNSTITELSYSIDFH